MTDRLYYDDAYCTSFAARVLCCDADGQGFLLRLNRSAFYPTSGGQPYDTGTIAEANVLDVFVDEAGEVWHRVDRPLEPGREVACQIDWPRRFDHMQQHAGEHMLANAVWRQLDGFVIGLHLGADVSSIDAELPGGRSHLTAEEIRALEEDVNEKIQRDVPIRASFPDAEALAAMPLRKPPTVKEHIRVVSIGDFECVACGGTHPSSSGQIGLMKIVDARPSKGKVRISFLCGMRAFRAFQDTYALAHAAAAEFSTAVENLPGAVSAVRAQLRQANRQIAALRREKLLGEAEEMIAAAQLVPGGARVVARALEADAPLLRDLATRLTAGGGVIALLCAPQEDRCLFVFARSRDVDCDMDELLSRSARACGGKGGGKPDFAQGGGPQSMLQCALESLLAARAKD